MKKLIVFMLALLFIVSIAGCSKPESNDEPFYFIGQIVGEHEWGGIVKVVDYGNHNFHSSQVILHQVRLGHRYSVGDYIRVEFDGLFLETDPPQIKSAISIKKTDIP